VTHLDAFQNISIGKGRLKGYKAALESHDIPVEESFIIETNWLKRGRV